MRILNSCQQNYATIQSECLAMFRAIKKCKFFLNGAIFFAIITDACKDYKSFLHLIRNSHK